jgi:enamine deaminase RidA (YjgF/YER057c/UK114 family)
VADGGHGSPDGTRDSGAPARRRISSGSRWEGPYGYSRAVVDGDRCWVAGTTDPSFDHPGDAAGQARAAFAVVQRALAEAGFGLADVVRTRMYVTDQAFADAVARVHGELFRDVRPAATLVVVSALIEPGLLVEVEVDARRSPA